MSLQIPLIEHGPPPGSIEELRDLIVSAFYRAFPDPQPGGGWIWVAGTYPADGYLIAYIERPGLPMEYWRYDFEFTDSTPVFSNPVRMELQYVPALAQESARRESLRRRAAMPRAEVTESARTVEATREGNTLHLTIIRAGFNVGRSRYYTESALRSGVEVFRGLKQYANHQTRAEERERPEGDVWQWVASLTAVAYDESARALRGTAAITDPAFAEKVALLDEQGLLNTLGVSIRAIGSGVEDVIEGARTFRVDEFTAGISVDFVTEPGAGGRVEFRESVEGVDVLTLTLPQLRERRPDLVAAVEAERDARHEEASMSDEQLKAEREAREAAERRAQEAEAALTAAQGEKAAAESALEQVKAERELATAQEAIGKLIAESGLPEPSKAHMRESLAQERDIEKAKQAIESHAKYVAQVTGRPVVHDNGQSRESATAPGTTGTSRPLAESFVRMGLSEDQAKRAAQVGR